MKMPASLAVFGFLAYLLMGCGGCGGAAPAGAANTTLSPTPLFLSLATVPDRTAWNNANTDGDTGVAPVVGDTRFDSGIQGYVGFALAAFPADAGITQATLVLPIDAIGGRALAFGDLFLDALDFDAVGFAYVPQLLRIPDATATPDARAMEVRFDVTALVRQALAAGRPFADFRLRFAIETNGDDRRDEIRFAAPGAPPESGNRLEVTYR